jgi:protoporphyrinogen oxidase
MLGLGNAGAAQTSLIEKFIYPKYGPGQMWETVARKFVEGGGTLHMQHRVEGLEMEQGRVVAVRARGADGRELRVACSQVISTMPIKELVQALPPDWAPASRSIALNLQYHDFITVGLLYPASALSVPLSDNWIYIQEPGVQVGRVQIFNNWSPYLVAQPDTVWMGLEFFCRDSDALWKLSDDELKALAQGNVPDRPDPQPDGADAVVIRVPKAYPGYFGQAYAQFDELRGALDAVPNLFLVGRNGMHRYNNQDHSMLTAKKAAELISRAQRQGRDLVHQHRRRVPRGAVRRAEMSPLSLAETLPAAPRALSPSSRGRPRSGPTCHPAFPAGARR